MGYLNDEQHDVPTRLFEATAAKAEIEEEMKFLEAKAMRIQAPIDEPDTLSCEDDEEYEPIRFSGSSIALAAAAVILWVLAWWDRGICVKFPASLVLTLSSCLVLAVAREGMRE